MPRLVEALRVQSESIEIWQYGRNDFEVQYKTSKTACRGSLLYVMQDMHDCYGVFDWKQIIRDL